MTTRRNYVTNPSGETATTGHTAVPGTTGVAAVTNPTATTAFGTKVARTTWSTASTAAGGGQYYELTLAGSGLAVGDVISCGIFHVLSHIANRLQFSLGFYNGAALIGSATLDAAKVVGVDTIYGAAIAADPAFELDAVTIPATTTKIRLSVLSVAGTSYANWTIGSYLQLDGLQIVKASTLGTYIDGAQGNAYGWDGAANASSSTQYTPSTELDGFADMDPSPRVQVTITDLYPLTDTITLTGTVAGRAKTVREAVRAAAHGAFTILDVEVAFGEPMTYQAQQYDAAGNELGLTPPAVITVTPVLGDGAVDWGVISDPLNPAKAVVVQFTENAAQRPSKPVPASTISLGARTVTLVGQRRLLTDLNMDFWTDTADDYAAIDDLIESSLGLVLIRTFAPMPVPRLLYCFMGGATPDDIDLVNTPEAEWVNTVQENTPSTSGYGAALFPWSIYKAAFPLWSDMKAAYSTWLDAKKNPPAGIG